MRGVKAAASRPGEDPPVFITIWYVFIFTGREDQTSDDPSSESPRFSGTITMIAEITHTLADAPVTVNF